MRALVGYHGVRLPLYVPRVVGYVARGAHRTVYGFTGWAFDREHKAVRMEAVRTLNLSEARAQYRQRKDRVKWRGGVFWAVTVLVAAAGVTAWLMLPAVQLALVALVLLVALAYVGRPKDRPAFAPAVVKTQYRRLTATWLRGASRGRSGEAGQGGPAMRCGGSSRSSVTAPATWRSSTYRRAPRSRRP